MFCFVFGLIARFVSFGFLGFVILNNLLTLVFYGGVVVFELCKPKIWENWCL